MLTGTLALVLATLGMSPSISQASGGGAPSVATPSRTAAAVMVPPKLRALEQKGLALALTSTRFSLTESVVGSGPPGGPFGHLFARAAASFALITVSGEQSFVPQEASFQASFLGFTLEGRLIGTTLYLNEPFIAHVDGGRPWVVEQHQSLQQAVDGELGALGGSAQSGATEAYGKLFETVNNAASIQDLGPMTINGQLTSAFGASVDLRRIVGGAKGRAVLKLFEPLARVEISLAEDGLPVRTRVTIALRAQRREPRSELVVESDILAINIPVTVKPPPAAQTITLEQLKKLARRASRQPRRRAAGEDGP